MRIKTADTYARVSEVQTNHPLEDLICMQCKMVKQKGHRADALALRAEERRDKLR